jgi:hypothetical protein
MSSVEGFVARAENAEKEIERLLSEIRLLEACPTGDAANGCDVPEELEKLLQVTIKKSYNHGSELMTRILPKKDIAARATCLFIHFRFGQKGFRQILIVHRLSLIFFKF